GPPCRSGHEITPQAVGIGDQNEGTAWVGLQRAVPVGSIGLGAGQSAGSGSLARRMFDALSNRFDGILKRLRGKGRLTEADVDEVLSEIRTALLEADVNVRVVRQVVARIREQVVGLELSKALSPSQQVIKIVNAELTNLLGGEALKIT